MDTTPESSPKPVQKPGEMDIIRELNEGLKNAEELKNISKANKDQTKDLVEKSENEIIQVRETEAKVQKVQAELKKLAMAVAKAMLENEDKRKDFDAKAEYVLNERYKEFKRSRGALSASVTGHPIKAKILENATTGVDFARSQYAAVHEEQAKAQKLAEEKGTVVPEEENLGHWAMLIACVNHMERLMDEYDEKILGDYSKEAPAMQEKVITYAKDKVWRANYDAFLGETIAMKDEFFKEYPKLPEDENMANIHMAVTDAWDLYSKHIERYQESDLDKQLTFLGISKMRKALEAYKMGQVIMGELKEEKKNSDVLTKEEGSVLVSEGESKGVPNFYYVGDDHPAFDIAADRTDIAFKVLDNGRLMELSEMDWKKVGGNPEGMQKGSWSRAAMQPEGEAVLRRTDIPELPEPLQKPAPKKETKPLAEEKKSDVAMQQPVVQPEKKPAPGTANPPAQEMKSNDTPIVEQKPVANVPPVEVKKPDVVPPQNIEQPAVAENVPERIKAILKQDGSIDVPTQETIYIAYYLPNGERQRNYVRFPATDIGRWKIDGMCTAQRTADGWTVRPEAGLPGALLFNVAGATTIIKLPENAPAGASPRPSERKEEAVDPDFPILSRLSGGK